MTDVTERQDGPKPGQHFVETFETADGKHGWRVVVKGQGGVPDNIVANDARQGYENMKDCLSGFFGMFFGDWDQSFLMLYEKWQSYAGTEYELPEGTQAGAPVRVDTSMPLGSGLTDPITEARKSEHETSTGATATNEFPDGRVGVPAPDGTHDGGVTDDD